MENSKIQWCDHTLNLWWGCVEVATGCDNCYAATLARRYGHDLWGAKVPRRLIRGAFKKLETLQRKAERRKEIHTVFVGSMMDIFEIGQPLINNHGEFERFKTSREVRYSLFRGIQLAHYENLVFQFLTKRPSNIKKAIPFSWNKNQLTGNLPENVWFGASASTQKEYETAAWQLQKSTPMQAKCFLSLEPMTEPIVMSDWLFDKVKWVIVGGESGQGARPFYPEWIGGVLYACKRNGVPCFVKQLGTHWAVHSNTYQNDAKGGNPEFWPEGLACREPMPL
jgi:protein gp37